MEGPGRRTQIELFLCGLADPRVGVLTNDGAVLLDTAKQLERGFWAGGAAVCLQSHPHDPIQDQRQKTDQCMSADAAMPFS